MYAQLILNPSWKISEVMEDTAPTKLGTVIVRLVQRDGLQKAADTLGAYPCWKKLDDGFSEQESSDGCVCVEGYGLAYDDFSAGGDGNNLYTYGLMTDGFLMAFHHPSRDWQSVDTSADDALEKFASFEDEISSHSPKA